MAKSVSDKEECTVCLKMFKKDDMFKCRCCGDLCCQGCCGEEDVSLCKDCEDGSGPDL